MKLSKRELLEIVRSVVAWHVLSLNAIATVGEKSIHDIYRINVWLSTSPSSEVIVELRLIIPEFGFRNTSLNVTVDEFPLVSELLSPGLVASILTPPEERFSILNTFPNESVMIAVVPVNELT